MAKEVLRRYPTITSNERGLVVAVNQEYQDREYVLSNGDEVALIPPVSGGTFFQGDYTESPG